VAKLLIVEDEPAAVRFLRRGLGEEGFVIDVATEVAQAEEAVHVNRYDAIILDVMLPGGDGFALCRGWRAAGLTTPILFLTARDDVADRVRGLRLGGDDYLVKPFAFAELVARIQALLRRGHTAPQPAELRIGDLTIEPARRRVTRAGRTLVLTAREYQMLEYLARRRGEVVTRADLWECVWESDAVPDSNVIDVYVRYLRNKLGREPDLIRTVRGGGYLLDEPEALGDV
jgi:two-component system copper resistance phosphate regulon response regulator CusR